MRCFFKIGLNRFCGGPIRRPDLGFTATRRLRKDSQCGRGFIAAALLKLRNPIGYSFHHFARRFTSSSCFHLGCCGPGLFAFFDYSDCFLLRHCFFSSFPLESIGIQRISRHTVPKFTELERWMLTQLAKKRPHPLTRRLEGKRATSRKIFFSGRVANGYSVVNRTHRTEHTGTEARQKTQQSVLSRSQIRSSVSCPLPRAACECGTPSAPDRSRRRY